jgi:hypothetical protein
MVAALRVVREIATGTLTANELASQAVLHTAYHRPLGGKALADLVWGDSCPTGESAISVARDDIEAR